jgi:hypothetical protein
MHQLLSKLKLRCRKRLLELSLLVLCGLLLLLLLLNPLLRKRNMAAGGADVHGAVGTGDTTTILSILSII